jgi:uncharacterized protein (TIGR03503 family)
MNTLMQFNSKRFVVSLALFWVACFSFSVSTQLIAQEESAQLPVSEQSSGSTNEQVAAVTAQAAIKKSPDIRTIIDISGSMKKTDPNNLRQPAMRLLVDLLPEDSKSGVWTFGQYVNMLVKHRAIDDQWKEEAKTKSQDVSSVGLFTNIGEALNTTSYDLDRLKPEYEPYYILLTDGMVDIDKDPAVNEQEKQRILKEIVPKLAEAGVKLHTIALSDKADQDFLKQLSLSTGGMNTLAENSDELLKAFVRLFDQSVPAEQVPLEGNKFLIDSSIEEFTALIFRKEGSTATQLIAPDESVINAQSTDPDVTWHQDSTYDLITIKRPYEGEWILQADADPDNRVTVVSNLSMQLDQLPSTIFSGEEINLHAWFDSADGKVTDPEFLGLLKGELRLTNESGKSISKEIMIQQEGEFKDGYSEKIRKLRRPGEFEISILVDGKTFKRERSHRIEVLEPFAFDTQYEGVAAESYGIVTATPLLQGIDLQKTKVIAKINSPDGSSLIASADLALDASGQQWRVQVMPTKGEGTYTVELDLSLVLETGKEFRLKPKPFELTLPYLPPGFIPPEPPVEEKPAVEPEPKQPEMSVPQEETKVAEEMPIEEPEPEDNTFMYVMAGVLALVAGVLGFLFYKLRSQKKLQDEFKKEQDSEDDEDMGDLTQLGADELNTDAQEADDLSEQVSAVKEELESMGAAGELDNAGITEDAAPELEEDDLNDALDQLADNQTSLDADDMMEDDSSDDLGGAFSEDQPAEEVAPVAETSDADDMMSADDIADELDSMLAEVESEVSEEQIPTLEPVEEDPLAELTEDTDSSDEADLGDLDSMLDEEEPDLEIDFDSDPDEASSETETSAEPDQVSQDELDAMLGGDDSLDDDGLEELLEEPSSEADDAGDSELDEAANVEDSSEEEALNELDDFGDSIDQALDEILAESDGDSSDVQTTEEVDLDDLDDLLDDSGESDELSDADVTDPEEDLVAMDELEKALGQANDGSESGDDSLDALDSMLDDVDAGQLEDISLDELEAPVDDGEVDIDKLMAEIDAEAMKQNQDKKDD